MRDIISNEEKFMSLYYGHNKIRSKKARDVDNGTTKGLTSDFGKMWVDPSRHDWPNVDTKVRTKLKIDEARAKKAFDNVRDILGESGFENKF